VIDRDALAQERGSLTWPELERHFARGVVVVVDPTLDLLDVAQAMARDERETFATWMGQGLVLQAQDAHARAWQASSQTLEAIVVAPWVLVSETPGASLIAH
jgi:hypothetical protein